MMHDTDDDTTPQRTRPGDKYNAVGPGIATAKRVGSGGSKASTSEDNPFSPDSVTKVMSASAPNMDLSDLDSSRSTSPTSKSSRRRAHVRRSGMVSPSGSPPLSPRRSNKRHTSNLRKSQSARLLRASSRGKNADNGSSHSQQGASTPEERDAIRATAAHMIEKAAKQQQLRQNRLQFELPYVQTLTKQDSAGTTQEGKSPAPRPQLKSSEDAASPSSLGFSTGTLGRTFDNSMDYEEEEGNYPMPPSLGSRSIQRDTRRLAFANPLLPPRKTGSDTSVSSISQFTTALFSSGKRESTQEERPSEGSNLGSTLLADQNERFRRGVDQSINLMDVSGANYGGSPERDSLQRAGNSPVRVPRRVAQKRASVIDIMFGGGRDIEAPLRGRSRQARKKSMVDIVLGPDPSKAQRSLSRGQVSFAKHQQEESCWSLCKRAMCQGCLVLFALAHFIGVIVAIVALASHFFSKDNTSSSEITVVPSFAPSQTSFSQAIPHTGSDGTASAKAKSVLPAAKTINSTDVDPVAEKDDDHHDWGDDTLTHLESLIFQSNLTAQEHLRDPQSSAYKALRWLGQLQQGIGVDDTEGRSPSFDWKDHQKEIEKYVLAVFYFSTTKPSNTHALLRERQRRLMSSDNQSSAKSRREKKVIDGTDWMKDDLVCNWRGIQCKSDNIVTHLKLPQEHLHGTIPSEIRGLKGLLELDLSHNHLHGTFPDSIVHLTQLTYVDLKSNRINGFLPEDIGHLNNLKEINVEMNDLEGTIPSLHANTDLSYLILSGNRLKGNIPLLGPKLIEVDLSANQLTGSLSSAFGDLSKLKHLKVHDNKLIGTVPSHWSSLSQIESMIMHHNNLAGRLPLFLSNMIQIQDIRLNHNLFTGTIPELSSLAQLTHLHLNNNELIGTIPSLAIEKLETLLLFNNKIKGDASIVCVQDVSILQRFAVDCKSQISCDCCQECH